MASIGFARVSTEQQELTNQLDPLESAGCKKIFHGKQLGISNENKCKLKELLKDLMDSLTSKLI